MLHPIQVSEASRWFQNNAILHHHVLCCSRDPRPPLHQPSSGAYIVYAARPLLVQLYPTETAEDLFCQIHRQHSRPILAPFIHRYLQGLSITKNYLPTQITTNPGSLWGTDNVLRNADGSEIQELRVLSRPAMSLIFDCMLRYKEEFDSWPRVDAPWPPPVGGLSPLLLAESLY